MIIYHKGFRPHAHAYCIQILIHYFKFDTLTIILSWRAPRDHHPPPNNYTLILKLIHSNRSSGRRAAACGATLSFLIFISLLLYSLSFSAWKLKSERAKPPRSFLTHQNALVLVNCVKARHYFK